jgi:hypothetical protein
VKQRAEKEGKETIFLKRINSVEDVVGKRKIGTQFLTTVKQC